MFLNEANQNFNFDRLIVETMLVVKPEELCGDVCNIDLEDLLVFFDDDALKLARSLISLRALSSIQKPSRPKRNLKST